ncbi:hypothetical protein SBDP1_1050003 [Syntrophobacter sp. SbD1]|nr:hypothetical protein SBDP1_1050003 [Syntrophobacter sp. SbD1]
MDIMIGATVTGQYRPDAESPSVEAKFLEIKDKGEAAGSGSSQGRIITLLVPEGQKIPRGVNSGDYRIYLKFVHRRKYGS